LFQPSYAQNAPAKAKPKSEIRFIEVDSGIVNPVDRLSKLPVEPVNKNIDKKIIEVILINVTNDCTAPPNTTPT